MKKSAAYMLDGRIVVQAMALTDTGVWIAYGEVFSLRTDDPAELASALRTSLANSIEDIAHPPQSEWKHIQRPLLQAAGVKTWAALGTKAKAVGVEWDGGSVAFLPSVEFRHHGGRANAGSTLHCGIDDERLGLQLLEAFERAS